MPHLEAPRRPHHASADSSCSSAHKQVDAFRMKPALNCRRMKRLAAGSGASGRVSRTSVIGSTPKEDTHGALRRCASWTLPCLPTAGT